MFLQLAESDFASTFRLLTVFAYGTYADYLGIRRGRNSGDGRWAVYVEEILEIPDLDPIGTGSRSRPKLAQKTQKKKKKEKKKKIKRREARASHTSEIRIFYTLFFFSS